MSANFLRMFVIILARTRKGAIHVLAWKVIYCKKMVDVVIMVSNVLDVLFTLMYVI